MARGHHGVIGLAAVAVVAAALVPSGLAKPVAAATPSPQNVTVPTAAQPPVTVTWMGTIPSGSHANSTCATVAGDPSVDTADIVVSVPAGLYTTSTATFAFSIKWTSASPQETTSDEVLTLVGPGGEIASSDGSTTTESVSQRNLAAATYHVLACGFVNTLPQAYTGQLTITTVVKPVATPTPLPGQPAPPHANPITFGVPSVMDPIHPFGEPDIAVEASGRTYVSGPAGTGTQRSLWESSVDGGKTYRVISPGPPPSAIQGTNAGGPGGGDTEIVFDNRPAPNQGMYFADLYALTCFRVAATHDGGKTVTQNNYPGGCAGNAPTSDRQWMAVYDPPAGVITTSAYGLAHPNQPLVYLEYNGSGTFWTKSTDGTTYTTADGGVHHFGTNAYVAIDQKTGKTFEATFGAGGAMQLNIGTPLATGDLCFLDDSATSHLPCAAGAGLITVAATPTQSSGGLFSVISIDAARNLYVGWMGAGNQTFVAAAPANNAVAVNGCTQDCWNNWTAPIQVSDGLVATGDHVNVFPWIKAGGNGMADMVWYGDSSNLAPSSTSAGHVWNVFMGQLSFPTNADGSINVAGGPADIQLVKVTPHPMDYLDICLSGTLCAANQGNRNLADFFEVTIDNTGAADIVYNDMSNGLIQTGTCATPGGNPSDHCGAALVTVVRQNAGMGLHGTLVNGPSAAPVTGLKGSTNDALYPVIQGTNLPAMDLTESDLSLSGNTLTVTMKVVDLTQIPGAATATQGALQEYFTRWQMGNTIYFAQAYATGNMNTMQFSAGATQSVDLCSVSLCDPHVLTYPEVGPNIGIESGSATCPTTPSATNPCTITITVNAADVGSPTSSSFLESVGAYAMSASHFQTGTTNAQAQADSVPIEIDGVCCYNFGQAPNPGTNTPESLWTPLFVTVGVAVTGLGVVVRRRRLRRAEV